MNSGSQKLISAAYTQTNTLPIPVKHTYTHTDAHTHTHTHARTHSHTHTHTFTHTTRGTHHPVNHQHTTHCHHPTTNITSSTAFPSLYSTVTHTHTHTRTPRVGACGVCVGTLCLPAGVFAFWRVGREK